MRRRRSPSDPNYTPIPPEERDASEKVTKEESLDPPQTNKSNVSFRVAKWAIMRLLGFVYFIAFLGALNQNKGLMGTRGLVPSEQYMQHLQNSFSSSWEGFREHPTLFWWIPLTDANMDLVAFIGILLSILVVLGLNSWLCMLLLWLLDFSIVTLAEGNSFYSYGWESQLLETAFLAIFLCDLPCVVVIDDSDTNRKKWRLKCAWKDEERNSPPSQVVLWLYRWLCFRISLGAGLIKIRGSSCWTAKTCLHYHFETQPIPSPVSFVFHFLPKSVLTRAVDLDLLVQLYTAWFVLMPSFNAVFVLLRRMGGFLQAGFMVNIILSGNFAFLNHLTIIPALACLDDTCWPGWLRRQICKQSSRRSRCYTVPTRPVVDFLLLLLIGSLSIPVITNLLQWGGTRQRMNASFDRFRLVNTYGAFGSVGQKRYEPIIFVSHDGLEWREVELPCKPGNVTRRPCFCAPYHYRLDWNIWFLGFKPHRSYLKNRESWLYNLLAKILDHESPVEERPWLQLLDRTSSEFLIESYQSNKSRPMLAKVDMYEYRMAASLWSILATFTKGESVVWWKRQLEESLIPPVQLNSDKRLEYASRT